MKKIVLIGGGTGTSTLLAALRQYESENAVIVSSADDGGSTGTLRRELGVFPPGDLRQCLLALAATNPELAELCNYRFPEGSLKGHAFGNILIAALEKTTGNIEDAIRVAGKIFDVQGDVIPVTLHGTLLSAVLENGETIAGEHAIDDSSAARTSPITQLILVPNGPANPRALAAIATADAIVLGPGDLHTSTLPNLLVAGIPAAIAASPAKKILVANIMTKHGQTDSYAVSDFVRVTEEHLGCALDVVIANSTPPTPDVLARYAAEQSAPVLLDEDVLLELGVQLVTQPLISSTEATRQVADPLARSILRHDGNATAKIIWEILA